ncbi:MAG: hypothetical protein HKN23_02970 [Verrucomicrobiales bacterium]|nr:hypothetical protein [Verrucomicrobiales bacterium]
MKKALTILGISVGIIFLTVLVIAFVVANRESEYFSPPDEPRAWAASRYDSFFNDPRQTLPVLSTASSPPNFEIDDSDPAEVKIKWAPEILPHQIGAYGERIDAGAGQTEITLPNGQIIRLMAIAYVRQPNALGSVDSQYDNRNVTLTWHDPLTLEPISDPESLNLPPSEDVQQRAELFLAFSCSDFKKRPIRWHWARMFDNQTSQNFGSSMSMYGRENVQIYSTHLHRFHSSPLRLALPVSYGEPEIRELDAAKPKSKTTFTYGPAEVTTLWAGNGHQGGSSSRSDGGLSVSGYRIRPATERSYSQSFSLIYIHPVMQGYTMESRRVSRDGKLSWSPIYPNSGIINLYHHVPLEKIAPVKIRQYPHLATGLFHVTGIPDLPKLDNLFDAKVGPIQFRYEHDIRQFIEQTTALQWNLHHSHSIDRSRFPLKFPDPETTVIDVLKEFEALIGTELAVDPLTYQIGDPKLSPFEKFKNWVADKLRRVF